MNSAQQVIAHNMESEPDIKSDVREEKAKEDALEDNIEIDG